MQACKIVLEEIRTEAFKLKKQIVPQSSNIEIKNAKGCFVKCTKPNTNCKDKKDPEKYGRHNKH